MGEVKQVNIKNRTYYFYNIIDLKDFDARLLKVNKKSYKSINVYYIGYITILKIDDYESIYSVNPLYLRINHASDILKETMGINSFYSVDENKEVLKKYADVWDGIRNKIKAMNDGGENDYWKDFMKIKFNSDDDVPLNKPLKFHTLTIIIRSIFEEDGKFYPQLLLNDTLYELV